MRIARECIDDLIARADIVEVISHSLPLRKAGRHFVACCPFHQEKTPSFSVNAEKQFYHCFGCGASGNVLSFIMEYQHVDFVEAIHELAGQLGMNVVYEEDGQKTESPAARTDRHLAIYQLLQHVADYYAHQLTTPAAAAARRYLEQRGIDQQTAQKFLVGFAPDAWDGVLKTFATQETALLQAGLLVETEQGRRYDRFRNRVIFPILDQRGRVIAFGGRVLDDSKPKYLNSPETAVFHKSDALYGWYQARQQRPLERLIIVEGYLDVIALAQFDVPHAIATLGTATSETHLRIIFRQVDQVIFCFDGDDAGYKAAWRALETCLSLMNGKRDVRFAFLPQGDDPDSLIRRVGTVAFQNYLQQAKPLSHFLFDHLLKRIDIAQLEGRARLVEVAKPLLAKLPEGAYQTLLVQRLNELTQVDFKKLTTLIQDAQPKHSPSDPVAVREKGREKREKISTRNIIHLGRVNRTPIQMAIQLLLHTPALAQRAEDIYSQVSVLIDKDGDAEFLMLLIELLNRQPDMHLGLLCEYWRGTPYEPLISEYALQENLLQQPIVNIEAEFDGILTQIKQQYYQYRYELLLAKSRLAALTPSEKQEFFELAPLLSRVSHGIKP
ncbi:DNA primase [Thioflexithrix psekupsensis]|uniref:DNA primase n=1 Tax=Thioflexithrix psekupsensis TaxID=1570016 RepID=UPI0015937F50|nr:DNA primase [Thioflexithrix psekupsensis]